MPSNNDGQIEDEALIWLMRVTSGEMTPQMQWSWGNWLAQSPAHRLAYLEAQAFWQGLGQLRERPVVAENLAKMKAGRVSPPNSSVHAIKPPAYAKRTFRLGQLTLMAACFALMECRLPNGNRRTTNRYLG